MDVLERRLVGTIPLEAGSALTGQGWRIRVVGVETEAGEPVVRLRVTRIAAYREGEMLRLRETGGSTTPFAAVNPGRGEAVALRITQRKGGSLSVVPGPGLQGMDWWLRPHIGPDGAAGDAVDEVWLAGARLMVTEWVLVGSYPVRAVPVDSAPVTPGS